MRIKGTIIAFASAFALSASASSVTTTEWGRHDPVETVTLVLRGPLEEFFRFELADAAQLSSTVVSSAVHGMNEKKGGTVSLVAERGDVDTLMGRYDFGWQTPTVTHLFDLQPGNYYYRLSRNDAGSNGGSYEMTSSIGATRAVAAPLALDAEVPEPQGIAFVLAALAALCWVSRSTRAGAQPEAAHGHRVRNVSV